jgi:uncharacterized cupredoxin-like copper-binding protein
VSTTPTSREHISAVDEERARGERIEERLSRIEVHIERGNREGRRSANAFAIFAVFALVLALGTMIAVATKLDRAPMMVANPRVTARAASTTAAGNPAPASRVAVGLREFSVRPSSTTGRAGRVTFDVRNAGSIPHEFVVLRTDKPAGDLLKGARADESGNVGETGDLQPGQAKTIRLDLKAGRYALICNLPGHYSAGQHTDFTVL